MEIREVVSVGELKRLNRKAVKEGYDKSLTDECIDGLPEQTSGHPTWFNQSTEYAENGFVTITAWLPFRGSFVPARISAKRKDVRLTAIRMTDESV